jgi:hypothetical protein
MRLAPTMPGVLSGLLVMGMVSSLASNKDSDMLTKSVIAALAACIGFTVSAPDADAGLFSATGVVIAVVADDVYVGEAEGHLNGSGTLAIRSQKNPALTCTGQFTSSAELGGSGQLQCSDGATATFQFKRLTVFRGYGVASFNRGEMRFAYGFTPEEAAPYLKLPEGKKLAHNGTELALIDR